MKIHAGADANIAPASDAGGGPAVIRDQNIVDAGMEGLGVRDRIGWENRAG